jgi:hypothetical protein
MALVGMTYVEMVVERENNDVEKDGCMVNVWLMGYTHAWELLKIRNGV